MSLESATTFNALPVCPKCGWAMISIDFYEHVRNCPNVAAGTAANGLAAGFPESRSTKFGYGDRQLVFELDDGMHCRLECRDNETFRLEDVWLLEALSPIEALDLVKTLANWRSTCIARRGQAAPSQKEEAAFSPPDARPATATSEDDTTPVGATS